MNYPSVKAIERAFPGKGLALRKLLDGRSKTREFASVQKLERECYHAPGYHYRLTTALNEVAGTHGCEAIWGADSCTQPAAEYLNTGDTYALTLLYDCRAERWRVTSWGDWLESQERRGRRFP